MGRKTLLIGLLIVATVAVGVGFLFWNARFAPPTLPNPNGYDDLLRAASQVKPLSKDWQDLTDEDQARYIADSAAAIALVDRALQKEVAVPLTWDHPRGANPLQQEFDRHEKVHGLGRAVLCAARDAAARDNGKLAVQRAILLLRLSRAMRCGGLVIDAMRSYAYQTAAVELLDELVPQLDQDACQSVADAIGDAPEEMEQVGELMLRDREFVVRGQPFLEQLSLRVHASTFDRLAKQTVADTEKRQRQVQRQMSALQVRVAVRTFELANGRLPHELSELSPTYLSADALAAAQKHGVQYQRNDVDDLLAIPEAAHEASASKQASPAE